MLFVRDLDRHSFAIARSIEPIPIGDQISLTGDTDHFLARMRPSAIPADNSGGNGDEGESLLLATYVTPKNLLATYVTPRFFC